MLDGSFKKSLANQSKWLLSPDYLKGVGTHKINTNFGLTVFHLMTQSHGRVSGFWTMLALVQKNVREGNLQSSTTRNSKSYLLYAWIIALRSKSLAFLVIYLIVKANVINFKWQGWKTGRKSFYYSEWAISVQNSY
jgi:hypothetical protein